MDSAIKKKEASFEFKQEDDEAEPISSGFDSRTPEKSLPQNSSPRSKSGNNKKEQSVEEYNKGIQDMNNKAFDKADEVILSNSDENIDNLDETIFVRHKDADMPAYIHGNASEKIFLIWD